MPCNCSDCGKIEGLHHIGVMTADIEAAIAFYTDVLGLEVNDRFDRPNGVKLAFLSVGSAVIELIQPVNFAQRGEGVVAHIAFAVKDIEQLMCRLYDKGVKFDTDKPADVDLFANGSRTVFFTGPNGERLEFFEQL